MSNSLTENSVSLKRRLVSVPNGLQINSVTIRRELEFVKSSRNVNSVPIIRQSTFVLNIIKPNQDVSRRSTGRSVLRSLQVIRFVPSINLLVDIRNVSNMVKNQFVQRRRRFVLQLRLTSMFLIRK